jgi:conjugal transfer mating pair stabilization protein TraN
MGHQKRRKMRYFLRLILIFIVSSTALAFDEEKCQKIQVKTCVDNAIRIIDGLETTNVCWKYEEKSRCISKEKNHCSALESNRGCDEKSAQCLSMGSLELCKNLEKHFSCGKSSEQKEIKHIETEFHVKRDEKDLSSCIKEEINKHCEEVEEKCIEPAETRNINGKDIHKDCWKWDRQYICRTDTFIDECNHLPENCKVVGEPICLHFNRKDNTCDHKEIKYQCNETKTFQRECKSKEFCLGGICEKSTRHRHNDFGSSISYLSVLAQMKSNELEGCRCPNGKTTCESSEIDPSSCKFFTGGAKQCVKATSQLNCCSDKGVFRDFIGCNKQEKDLFKLRKSKLCHHVGSWRGKKWNKFKKYQSHCCFKSKLAKIIQVQGRQQLGIGWGDHKNPDCRSLNLEELRRLDFSKIDFTELYTDIVDKVSSGMNASQEKINQKMGSYKDGGPAINDKSTSEMINKKIKQFYEQKK